MKLTELSAPVGRSLLALIFIVSGVNKINGYSGTQAYMEAMGVTGSLLPLVIFIEIVGGFAIVLGWQARFNAFILAGFTFVAALLFHTNFSDQMQMIMFMKNIAITGAFLMIVAQGAGPYSIDNAKK